MTSGILKIGRFFLIYR